jgi:hypothetical protein
MKKMIFLVICLALSGCAGKRLPLVKVSGYTSSNASATSNGFLLNKVTSEFSVGNIVTIGDSKKEHEIISVTALNKSESGNSQSIILMDGVGFVVKKGWKVSVVGGGSLLDPPPHHHLVIHPAQFFSFPGTHHTLHLRHQMYSY